MPQANTIAVAMSGGVDSSTVAAMLRAEGHSVIGLTMQLWNQRRLAGRPGMPESVQGRCCSLDDVYDARRVAETIGIPYYVVNHEDRFERDVVRLDLRVDAILAARDVDAVGRAERRQLRECQVGKDDFPAQDVDAEVGVNQDKCDRRGEGKQEERKRVAH